jgi:hypothetical protein
MQGSLRNTAGSPIRGEAIARSHKVTSQSWLTNERRSDSLVVQSNKPELPQWGDCYCAKTRQSQLSSGSARLYRGGWRSVRPPRPPTPEATVPSPTQFLNIAQWAHHGALKQITAGDTAPQYLPTPRQNGVGNQTSHDWPGAGPTKSLSNGHRPGAPSLEVKRPGREDGAPLHL